MSFGIRVSQPGINVEQASDFQLAFTSDWPVLKIHKQGAFTLSDDTVSAPVTSHDLGYPPAFMILKVTGNVSELASPGGDELGDSFYTDNTILGYSAGGGATGVSYTGYYYIFRLDLTKNFQAPTIALGTQAPSGGGNFGVKTSKPNKDANDSDFRNLSLDSSTRSPMIHQIVAGSLSPVSGNFDLVATHNLLYAPFFLTFESATGANKYFAFFGGNAFDVLVVNDKNITQRSNTAKDGSIIVFKDPFFFL